MATSRALSASRVLRASSATPAAPVDGDVTCPRTGELLAHRRLRRAARRARVRCRARAASRFARLSSLSRFRTVRRCRRVRARARAALDTMGGRTVLINRTPEFKVVVGITISPTTTYNRERACGTAPPGRMRVIVPAAASRRSTRSASLSHSPGCHRRMYRSTACVETSMRHRRPSGAGIVIQRRGVIGRSWAGRPAHHTPGRESHPSPRVWLRRIATAATP